MRALDAVWLEMEGHGPPIAIGTVAVADGPAPGDDDLLAMLAERLPAMPRLHQEPAPGRVGLRRATWVEAEQLDLTTHLHRVSPTGRGDRAGLDAVVGGIMETRLPDGRPLWDLWIVDGLEEDRFAVVWRVHHSIADGLGALSLLGGGFDLGPEGGRTLADAVAEAGSAATAARRAAAPQGRLGALRAAARASVAVAGALPGAAVTARPRLPGPLTGPVGPHRRWASVDVPLAEVKAVGRAAGATVNDVVLAAVAGGFRDLLHRRGQPVRGRVVRNLVPVSVRSGGDAGPDNQVSALFAHLPVGLADPRERLAAVVATAGTLKRARAPVIGSALLGVLDRAAPSRVQDLLVATAGVVGPAWFFDTLTTNVPGPQFPVWFCGRRVHAMYPVIPVAGRTRITTGVFSYDGTLNVGVTGDGDHAGDVRVLADGIRTAVQELSGLLGRSGSGGRRGEGQSLS